MIYVATWRFLVVLTTASVAAWIFFTWWIEDPFVIGSTSLSAWLASYWWFVLFAVFLVVHIASLLLLLFSRRLSWPYRVVWTVVTFLIPPAFIMYWLLYVERGKPNNSFKPNPLRGSA